MSEFWHTTVEECLKNIISMGSDVICLSSGHGKVFKHSKDCMFKDDVPEEFWDIPVLSIGLCDDFPDKIVLWVSDDYVPRAAKFLNELDELCIKYDISISHEDSQGSFILETYDDYNIKWLRAARKAECVL